MTRSVYVQRSIPRVLAVRAARRVWPGAAYSRLGPVHDRTVDEVPLPGSGWVRIRNLQCGICATDVAFLHAEIDPRITLVALPGRDRVYLGHELLGEVVQTGPGVDRVAVGDRVILDTRFQGPTCRSQDLTPLCRHCAAGNYMLCTNPKRFPANPGTGGGWSEHLVCHSTEIYKVPARLSDDQAMLVEPFSLGIRAALKRLPKPDEQCLIIGAGMAGLTITQSVRLLSPDSHITVLARYRHQAEMAERLGANRVLRDDSPIRLAGAAGAPLFRGPLGSYFVMGGFDVVYDCVGSADTVNTSLRLATAGGSVVLVGISLRGARIDLSPVWHQEVQLIGVLAHGMESWESNRIPTYELVCREIGAGNLSTDGFITDRYPLAEWKAAVRRSQQRAGGVVRVVLDITPSNRR